MSAGHGTILCARGVAPGRIAILAGVVVVAMAAAGSWRVPAAIRPADSTAS